MWGLFVGLAIGVLQVLAVVKLGGLVFGNKPILSIAGIILFFIKMTAIVLILYLISTISLEHLIWTAGGMLAGLVAVSVYLLKRRKKAPKEDIKEDLEDGV